MSEWVSHNQRIVTSLFLTCMYSSEHRRIHVQYAYAPAEGTTPHILKQIFVERKWTPNQVGIIRWSHFFPPSFFFSDWLLRSKHSIPHHSAEAAFPLWTFSHLESSHTQEILSSSNLIATLNTSEAYYCFISFTRNMFLLALNVFALLCFSSLHPTSGQVRL